MVFFTHAPRARYRPGFVNLEAENLRFVAQGDSAVVVEQQYTNHLLDSAGQKVKLTFLSLKLTFLSLKLRCT